MKVIICDDEKQICDLMRGKLISYSVNNDLDLYVEVFPSGEALLEKFPEDADIIFLDIEMSGKNGMETAEEIRKKNSQVHIVFLTVYEEYVFESFKVGAFRYLLKPLKDEEFLETMDALKERIDSPDNYLMLRFHKEYFRILYEDILYIEVVDHKVWIHCEKDTYQWRGTLEKLREELDGKGFYQIHRSYLIHVKKIRKYNSQKVWFANGMEVPISKNRLNGFKEEYIKLWSKGV